MSTEDLFAALGDSFQLAEDDGNFSVGSFGDNDNNLDFSSELVFADLDKEHNDPPALAQQKTEAHESGGGSMSQNNNSHHSSNHGSISSLPGSTGLAAGLPPPPSMKMSMTNSLNNSSSTSMNPPAFRGPSTATSSAALQNAAASLQGASQFSFAQQNRNETNSNSFIPQQQQQQQQFRAGNQGFMNNSNSSHNMNNSLNRSNSMNTSMQMNRSSSMQSAMLNNRMNNHGGNNGSMGNAVFNNPMPPPSRSSVTTPSMSSNNMFKNSFSNNSQQHQNSNALFQQTSPNQNPELEKPKRPLSAFEFFCQERKRLGFLSDNQLQIIWKDQLDPRQKNIYLQQSRVDRQRYITELKLWKARTEQNQPAGALGSFLKARLQGSSNTDLQQVEANKRGRLQPAIVSCPNLNVSPSMRLQAMQQQQMGFQGGGQQNATFDNFQQPISGHSQGGDGASRSRFVANQMQRLQQGQGLADLASELGNDGTNAFVSAMLPRSQSASVVQHGSNSLRFKQQQSSPNMQQQDPNNMMDPLMEFPGF